MTSLPLAQDDAPGSPATLTFHGAAGTVTGSKYLLKWNKKQILIDCGLFQGLKALRLRNWDAPPFDPAALDAVVLSHAHVDHAGYLPLLCRRGFAGPIYCTAGTADLLRVLLPDSAHLMQEEAAYANRKGYSKHHPALPLYDAADVERVFPLLRTQSYDESFSVMAGLNTLFRRAGHILGSASVELRWGDSGRRLVFSGDLGRWDRPIMRDPDQVPAADVLLIEATYGDRLHAPDPRRHLARVIRETAKRGGAILIPAFAVGRVQELIWTLRQLEDAGEVPTLPVYLDSPMAIDVNELYCRHPEDYDQEMARAIKEGSCPICCRTYHLVRTVEESKELNQRSGPMVIIAGSGMMTGGRILHHLKQRLSDPRSAVLLVGYQAEGTRGRALLEGATRLRMFGEDVPVNAQIEVIDGLSAHADQSEILRWLSGFQTPPAQTYVVHGEPGPAQVLSQLIRDRLGWKVDVAQDGATVPIVQRAQRAAAPEQPGQVISPVQQSKPAPHSKAELLS